MKAATGSGVQLRLIDETAARVITTDVDNEASYNESMQESREKADKAGGNCRISSEEQSAQWVLLGQGSTQ